MTSIEEIPLDSPRLKEFVKCPWQIHRGDPYWTPPLKGDLLGNRLLGLPGLLTKNHPYHLHAEATHFLASRNGRPVGRISASISKRYNDYYKSSIGFFGFFDVIEDYSIAESLLDHAKAWVVERNMDILQGPGEYTTASHDRQGVLIDGFDTPPTMETTYNPPYYSIYMDRYGFRKAKDYYAYHMPVQIPVPERLTRLAERVKTRRNIKTRQINLKDLINETKMLVGIYNESWKNNWGYLPITDGEAIALAKSLRSVADEGLVRFAFVDEKPAAVIGALPDPYYPLRPRWRWYRDSDIIRVLRLLRQRRRIPATRLMFFGVRPGFRQLGIDALLFNEMKQYAMKKGYQTCEASLLLEDNHLILSPSEFMGAKQYKTWRIYDLPLK